MHRETIPKVHLWGMDVLCGVGLGMPNSFMSVLRIGMQVALMTGTTFLVFVVLSREGNDNDAIRLIGQHP
jgi:hypothetical protein